MLRLRLIGVVALVATLLAADIIAAAAAASASLRPDHRPNAIANKDRKQQEKKERLERVFVVEPPSASTKNSKRVAIIGCGMGGLAAAHELAERGFTVECYERREYVGGKSHSGSVRGTGTDGRRDLPNEHGFRFFPNYYQHVPDTMSRIPYHEFGREGVVEENLVNVRGGGLCLLDYNTTVTLWELVYFAQRILLCMSSCHDRYEEQYDDISYRDFMNPQYFSEDYYKYLVKGIVNTLVAAKPEIASLRTMSMQALRMVYPFYFNFIDRLLNGPTDDVWILPWKEYLESLGVVFHLNAPTEAILYEDGQITGFNLTDGTVVSGYDYYISAVPFERLEPMLSDDIKEAAPSLSRLDELVYDWMVGIQYYIDEDMRLFGGHSAYFDSTWALTAISQAQFWEDFQPFEETFGDGTVKGVLSFDVSDWFEPGFDGGPAKGKMASESIREEVAREVWHQAALHMGTNLPEDMSNVVTWYLDENVHLPPESNPSSNETPLLINTVGSQQLRPNAYTEIPNLFVASDFVKTGADLATMESANEAGRSAANAILAAEGRDDFATIYDYPYLRLPLRQAADCELYAEGENPEGWDWLPPGYGYGSSEDGEERDRELVLMYNFNHVQFLRDLHERVEQDFPKHWEDLRDIIRQIVPDRIILQQ